MTPKPDRSFASPELAARYDVVIVGAGLAGLTLARHLQLETDLRVLQLERRAELPPREQKYGEATVQLSAFYYAKVLDLEEHLIHDHLMKYNLRFYWTTAGRANAGFEELSQAYIRNLSNIASYQIDRNALEGELVRRLSAEPRVTLLYPVSGVAVDLAPSGSESDHRVRFRDEHGATHEVGAGWVVDTSGRTRLLARRLGLARPNSVHHGAYFLWVEGNLDIERLTGRTLRERRLARERAELGHLPFCLATNHFCGEGLWFWVIPLRDDKTSLGLVFDRARVPPASVSSAEKMIAWVCERFPLFARDLPQRKILYDTGLLDFSHGCTQSLSADRWAFSGEAGRFLDPLYSPGGDFIALHNTLIVDAIKAGSGSERADRCRRYEQLLRGVYDAFTPSYAISYDLLGDAECFSLKYVWELTIYFGFYVFAFMNELFTEPRGFAAFVSRFSRLGQRNRDLHAFLLAYYHWKKEHLAPLAEPRFFDFASVAALERAERCFYRVGVSVEEAREVLDEQLANVEELGRFFVAWVASRVLGEPRLVTHRAFVATIDLAALRFDPAELAARWAEVASEPGEVDWGFPSSGLERFRTAHLPAAAISASESARSPR